MWITANEYGVEKTALVFIILVVLNRAIWSRNLASELNQMLWVQNRKKCEWMKGWEKKMFNKLYFICIKIKGISWDRVMMRSLLKRVWLKNIHVSFMYSIHYGLHGSVSATFFKHFKNVSKSELTWRGYCGMINIDNNSKKKIHRAHLSVIIMKSGLWFGAFLCSSK